ncbi:MAG: hypothetical protein QXP56_06985 [Archaeoglobaceae archaeon]
MKCYVCGLNQGVHEFEFSDNFVSYGDVFEGERVCDLCFKLLSDPKYRRSNWIVQGNEIRLLEKEDLLKVLLDVPPGSLVYVRSIGKRLAFLKALKVRSTATLVAVCGEEEGVVMAKREKLKEFIDLANKAREAGIKKTEMLEGCSTASWKHKDLCTKIEEVRSDPLWRIVVRAL